MCTGACSVAWRVSPNSDGRNTADTERSSIAHISSARAVVDAVVKLAHALGLKVVAEGVENPRQHTILVELGCDELQGYLFAKPMTARALLLWAMDDRSVSAVFRPSLFGETRQASLNAPLQADPS